MKNKKDKIVLITAVLTLPLLILYNIFKIPSLAIASYIGLIILTILIIGRIIKP